MEKAKVYFIREITEGNVIKLYEKVKLGFGTNEYELIEIK